MPIIQSYVDASNAHDVKSILACFADEALVRDENATRRGKIDIERLVTETIDKYKFHFKPLSTKQRANETVVQAWKSQEAFRAARSRLIIILPS